MVRVVLDPGVLIAAAITPHGVCGEIIRELLAGHINIIVCPLLIDELEEVLLRAKFRRYLTEAQVGIYVGAVKGIAEHVPDPLFSPGLTPDPDDDYLIALAYAVGADFLVSGDPHITNLSPSLVPVLNPRAFLNSIVR